MIRRIWDVTLTVTDLSQAVAFYRDLLGLPLKYQFPDYAGFDVGGVELGLKTWGGKEPPREGEPVVNFLVDDVDRAFQELSAKGVRFTKAPEDTPWGGRIALFQDPDGNTLQLTQIDWKKYFSACAG
jgi:lactoylglutathione lyase